MDKQLLDLQADKVEMVFATFKAPVRVWGGCLTPSTIQFHLAPAITTKVTRLESLTGQVALALGAPQARLTHAQGRLTLEIARGDGRTVSYSELAARLKNDSYLSRALGAAGTAILGIDTDGVPLLLRLSSPDVAHCLISGTTGSGKTELVRTLVASLATHQAPRDLQLALFDPKGHGLAQFAGLPHLLFPIVREAADAIEWLRYLVDEMQRRDRGEIERPRIVVVIDELADLLQSCGPELQVQLTRLVQRGRSAGISVVACTQKPTSKAVGTLIKANFPVRIVGRVASVEDARVAAGVGGSGAEKLIGRGDFVLVAGAQVIRFQAAFIRPEEYETVLAATHRGRLDWAAGRLRRS